METNELIRSQTALMNEADSLLAEDKFDEWEAKTAEVKKLDRKIAAHAEQEKLKKDILRSRGPSNFAMPAIPAVHSEKEREKPGEKEIFRAWCRGHQLDNADFDTGKAELMLSDLFRASPIISTTAAYGGTVTPGGFVDAIGEARSYIFPVSRLMTQVATSDGRDLDKFLSDDTGSSAFATTEDTPSLTDTQRPTYSKVTLKAFEYNSGVQLITWRELEDLVSDPVQHIARNLGQRLEKTLATDRATGNGSTTLEGLLTSSTDTGVRFAQSSGQVMGGTTGTNLLDTLLQLHYSLDVQYWAAPNLVYLVSPSCFEYMRLSQNSLGDYQWGPPPTRELTSGAVNTFDGLPVYVWEKLGSVFTSGQTYALCIDMSRIINRVVTGADTRLVRFDEIYASSGCVGFMYRTRLDQRAYNEFGGVYSSKAKVA